MTITMPEDLQKLSDVVVGTDFPEGDEDALRRLAEAWMTCAGEVGSVLGDTEAAIKDALSTMDGQTAEAFKEYGDKLTQGDEAPMVLLQTMCEQLGEACDKVALDVEYTKASIITALSLLLAQIAAAIAMAAFTFGASTATIPAMHAVTRGVVAGLIRTLLQQIATQTAINVGANFFIDRLIQLGQFAAGDRKEWDTDKLNAALISGAAGGLGGGIAGGVFGGAAGAFATRHADDLTKPAADQSLGSKFANNIIDPPGGMNNMGGWASSFGYGTAGGTAGGTMGGALNNEFQGSEHNEQNMGSAALGGAAGGALGTGSRGYDSGLEQGTLPDFGSIFGQNSGSGNQTPDPNAGQGSQPDPNAGQGSQPDPNAGQGSQPDPNAGQGSQPDPNAGQGSQPDPNAGQGSQPDPNAGQGSQPDPNAGQGSQPDPNAGQGTQGSRGTQPDPNAGQGSQSNPNTGQKKPVDPVPDYTQSVAGIPPHMVNAPGDMYTEGVELPENPEFEEKPFEDGKPFG